MKIEFQVSGIQTAEIQDIINYDESSWIRSNIKKVTVDSKPGYPCRWSLEDAEIGEEVLLFTYTHHAVESPYRSSGPVYIRPMAKQAQLKPNQLPLMLHHRLLSLRVYNQKAFMIDARTIEGKVTEETIQDIFRNPEASYIHVHNSGPGCYNCQINRIA